MEGSEATTGKSAGSRKRRIFLLTVAVLASLGAFCYFKLGVYTVQPIGAIPEGGTVVIWRDSEAPFFDSPDGLCLRRAGEVSLLLRAVAMKEAPTEEQIILRLPYSEFAYLQSTGGKSFDR
jgi:hypothetical protein